MPQRPLPAELLCRRPGNGWPGQLVVRVASVSERQAKRPAGRFLASNRPYCRYTGRPAKTEYIHFRNVRSRSAGFSRRVGSYHADTLKDRERGVHGVDNAVRRSIIIVFGAGRLSALEAAMYAVIDDRGNQVKVSAGDVVDLDLLAVEAGSEVIFDRVLVYSDESGVKIGKPTVEGASVVGEVIGEVKGRKVYGVSFRRRKNSKVRKGHRQKYSRVEIKEIRA